MEHHSCTRAHLSLPGIHRYIIQRGNDRSVCFYAKKNYQFYLHCLKEFADKFGCAVAGRETWREKPWSYILKFAYRFAYRHGSLIGLEM